MRSQQEILEQRAYDCLRGEATCITLEDVAVCLGPGTLTFYPEDPAVAECSFIRIDIDPRDWTLVHVIRDRNFTCYPNLKDRYKLRTHGGDDPGIIHNNYHIIFGGSEDEQELLRETIKRVTNACIREHKLCAVNPDAH